jgi:hypothetical protein
MAADDERSEEDRPSLELPRPRAFRRSQGGPAARPVEPVRAETVTAVLPESDEDPDRPLSGPGARRRRPRPPRVPTELVVLLAGALTGLLLVGGTWAGLRGCTAVRGTPSCGMPGVGLLLLIVVVAGVVGSLVMRLGGVAGHAGTSALGTGLLCVLVLLALLPYDERWWMVLLIPGLGMATFLASWWLITTNVQPGPRAR